MNINIQKDSGSWGKHVSDCITLVLDNGNEIRIIEAASGVLEIENITETVSKSDEYGLMISPQNYSTIHIIPEG